MVSLTVKLGFAEKPSFWSNQKHTKKRGGVQPRPAKEKGRTPAGYGPFSSYASGVRPGAGPQVARLPVIVHQARQRGRCCDVKVGLAKLDLAADGDRFHFSG